MELEIVKRLEFKDWETAVSWYEVSVGLAAGISVGNVRTSLPPDQVVAGIQSLLVDAGAYTDDEFMFAFRSECFRLSKF